MLGEFGFDGATQITRAKAQQLNQNRIVVKKQSRVPMLAADCNCYQHLSKMS